MAVDPFTFDHPPTKAETEKFEYAAFDYFDNNPGYINSVYVSYVGVYFNANGTLSGIYVANSSVTQY